MNATSLYVSTCRYILHADHENPDSWGDLYRLLPYLRQSLSCCVCGNLLSDPMGPTNSTCQHHVCKGCIGGKMLLKPSCSWCKDYSLFAENKQLQILLSCYKKLCEYIADTPIARNMVGANGGTSNTLAILQEGMAIQEGNAYAQSKKNLDDQAVHVNIMELLTKANKTVPSMSEEPAAAGTEAGSSTSTINANHNHDNAEVPPLPTTPPTTNGGTPNRRVSVEAISPSTSSPTTSPQVASNHCGNSNETGLDSEGGMTSSASYSVSLSSSGEMPRIKIKRKHKGDRDGKEHKKKKKDKKHKRHRHKRTLETNEAGHSGINSDSPTPPKVKKLIISGHRAKLLKSGRKLQIRGGCRCGTGGPKPGMFTCLGARCPCYVSEMECTKCRCRGCRNPYTKPRTAIPAHVMRQESKEDSDVDIDVTE
ncbi:uncharacterized protein [Amphiura filiformis]|uniref:uncharacterized protein n=1 Tax=Amphiura filiformis TaxID=82378 RepID=UPI003B210D1C